jgi:transcription initiation factor TFIIH subunit 4
MERMQVVEFVDQNLNSAEWQQDLVAEEKKEETTVANKSVKVKSQFFHGVKLSITSLNSTPWAELTPAEQKSHYRARLEKHKETGKKLPAPPPTLSELEMYTQSRWDSVLHYLVGSDYESPPAVVVHFLEKTGLMQEDTEFKNSSTSDAPPPLVITSKGYEFMLQDVHVQLWSFIVEYLATLESHPKCNEIRKEALLFLICLSYCRVGSAYPASSLSEYGKILMKDFSQFGLLFVYKLSSSMTLFFPTRVAVNLIAVGCNTAIHTSIGGEKMKLQSQHSILAPSSASTRALEVALASSDPSSSPHLAIIVQTNFQLCAYTTSELHISMVCTTTPLLFCITLCYEVISALMILFLLLIDKLGLFCEISTYRRLPNVIFFRITRDSIKSAFRLGISSW